jgi:hypothetical protein
MGLFNNLHGLLAVDPLPLLLWASVQRVLFGLQVVGFNRHTAIKHRGLHGGCLDDQLVHGGDLGLIALSIDLMLLLNDVLQLTDLHGLYYSVLPWFGAIHLLGLTSTHD